MRDVALKLMQAFADQHGFPLVMREEVRGDLFCFIGTAPDGCEYAIGFPQDAA